jgi:hypothetical protein
MTSSRSIEARLVNRFRTSSCKFCIFRQSWAENSRSYQRTHVENHVPVLRADARRFATNGGDGLLAVDNAAFHDERYPLQGSDVIEGVAGDADYIGGVAGLEDADFILPAQ